MRLASLILSLCLHAIVFLIVWFWPAPASLRIDAPPITISLVDGAPGGARAPTPILGHVGKEDEGPLAPAPPAPQSEIAAPERVQQAEPKLEKPLAQAEPAQSLIKPEPVKVPEKQPAVPVAEPKKIETPKPEVKKQEQPKPKESKKNEEQQPVKPKQETKKELPKKQPPKKPVNRQDPVSAALAQARKATSRASSSEKGSSIEQALAQARRSASGTGGGGGGEGDGPGGGGLGDVYIGQVMLAVRPNWGYATSARISLVCVVKVNVDMQGKVLNAVISRSSGNAQFDASAVNAITRTSQAGDFPPPPNPSYADLDLVFTLDEMRQR